MPITLPKPSARSAQNLRSVQASEAKTQFLRLLDDVASGETIVITRHGRRIARIVPDETILAQHEATRREKIHEAIRGMEELRQRVGKMSVAEIIDAKNEGRQ